MNLRNIYRAAMYVGLVGSLVGCARTDVENKVEYSGWKRVEDVDKVRKLTGETENIFMDGEGNFFSKRENGVVKWDGDAYYRLYLNIDK